MPWRVQSWLLVQGNLLVTVSDQDRSTVVATSHDRSGHGGESVGRRCAAAFLIVLAFVLHVGTSHSVADPATMPWTTASGAPAMVEAGAPNASSPETSAHLTAGSSGEHRDQSYLRPAPRKADDAPVRAPVSIVSFNVSGSTATSAAHPDTSRDRWSPSAAPSPTPADLQTLRR